MIHIQKRIEFKLTLFNSDLADEWDWGTFEIILAVF